MMYIRKRIPETISSKGAKFNSPTTLPIRIKNAKTSNIAPTINKPLVSPVAVSSSIKLTRRNIRPVNMRIRSMPKIIGQAPLIKAINQITP